MIAAFDASSLSEAMRVGGRLREQGLRVLVYPDADKIGKQIKYADSADSLRGDAGRKRAPGWYADYQESGDAGARHTTAGGAGAAILEALRQRG
jgi:hypothetical protein